MNEYLFIALVLAAVIAAVILLVKLIASPLRKIFKLLLNTALGMGILFVLNLIGQNFGFSFEINPTRCLIAALFGVPGVIIMIVITVLL
ncbi:MAG: pro-sigmaK processing inhibitor BofA family protein [Eubacteriales bacterium]|nr:pro-sigmaK processing inhibitor BofA family protein [Eubacteriales bacterium]